MAGSRSYRTLQLYAIAISVLSVVYNGAEGGVSIGFGAESSSRALVFFGIQSAVEVASALIVLWRFRSVAKPGEERGAQLDPKSLRFEKISTLLIGLLLNALSIATVITAITTLVYREHPDSSNAELIISATALVLMVLIWLPKRYLAKALNSSTMQGEATCSLSCIQITFVLFVGSLIYRLWHGGWWVDSATSIILGLLFGWEGVKMVRWARDPGFDGGCCGSCRPQIPAAILEEGERYRDICSCCEAKEECRTSDKCQCESVNAVEQGCCRPMSANDEKCCTRKVVLGRPPSQEQHACNDPCCANEGANKGADEHAAPSAATNPSIDSCKDACCANETTVISQNKTKGYEDKCCASIKEHASAEPADDEDDCCKPGGSCGQSKGAGSN